MQPMPKIGVLMNVYNSEDYLPCSLEGIYEVADKIIIIDGAYNLDIGPSFSTDGTEEIINEFPDKEHKIHYVMACSINQVEQRNRVWREFNEDWLFIVDDDEVYKKNELTELKPFLAQKNHDSYLIKAFVFVDTFNQGFIGYYPRLFQYKDGMQFVAPNKLIHDNGAYQPAQVVSNLTMYHYSEVRGSLRTGIRKKQYQFKVKPKWDHLNLRIQKLDVRHPKSIVEAKHVTPA